ncbi:ATP-binding cassette domain-containing protein [Edaphobacter modestus]|uniref:Molybdate transport system ATP-binding protein n=1 Tax=Edaphobacter modestus TaxID=388466 RepID=A0A4V6MFT3_9BACT|nr:ATP-binding cassette domain-containing protein [Edaphobacter modestus]RZU39746.1 molybdate transport system ATP-binding protein [Edaphobacter modestus]
MEGRPTLSDSLLDVRMRHRVGGVALDVEFGLTAPWTVLFGPSGSGKTTVLRAIAGFVRPAEGRIVKGGDVLIDTAAGEFVPAHRRPVRSAAQTAWLFPHKTVRWNLVYGNGWTTKPVDGMGVAEEVMSLFRLRELADRMPADLSGGERQRVSVARTVVSARTFRGAVCPLLLLDEPFTGLDAALRDELVIGLREWLGLWKVPVLSVTHDLGEAFQLGAEVIKLADGRIVEQGQVEVVLAEERRRLLERLRAE